MSTADTAQKAEGSYTKEEKKYSNLGPVLMKQELGRMVLTQMARESGPDAGSNPLH